jgi:hypothetical protein
MMRTAPDLVVGAPPRMTAGEGDTAAPMVDHLAVAVAYRRNRQMIKASGAGVGWTRTDTG